MSFLHYGYTLPCTVQENWTFALILESKQPINCDISNKKISRNSQDFLNIIRIAWKKSSLTLVSGRGLATSRFIATRNHYEDASYLLQQLNLHFIQTKISKLVWKKWKIGSQLRTPDLALENLAISTITHGFWERTTNLTLLLCNAVKWSDTL